MRISDWSSDVCSSDLRSCPAGEHRFPAWPETRSWLTPYRDRKVGGSGQHSHSAAADRTCGQLQAFTVPGFTPWQTTSLVTQPALMTTSRRSEEHTSELQSLMRTSYSVFCLKKKTHI